MHPISLSLLHSSPHNSSQFYNSTTAAATCMNTSSPSPSPVKRSRNGNDRTGAGEEWLPSPSPMSVDSGSPPPPTVNSASINGHSTLPPSVSSNGYSPSPMSTGSYEPPYSPGGKMGKFNTMKLGRRKSGWALPALTHPLKGKCIFK